MDRRSLKLLGTAIAIVAAGLYAAIEKLPQTAAPHTAASVSWRAAETPLSSRPVTFLKNLAYEVGYSEAMKDPLWVEYDLQESERSSDRQSRPKGGFATDLRTSAQVTSRDYVGSGYDRGHMAPSYAIGDFHGRDAQQQTFIMSNVVPQTHFCNDGVWNSIERMEADDFAKRFGEIEVVDGPIFDANPARFPRGVAVPSAFYKAIRRPDGQVIAFIVPQRPLSPRPEDYLASLDEIKSRTGITLFPGASPTVKAQHRTKIW